MRWMILLAFGLFLTILPATGRADDQDTFRPLASGDRIGPDGPAGVAADLTPGRWRLYAPDGSRWVRYRWDRRRCRRLGWSGWPACGFEPVGCARPWYRSPGYWINFGLSFIPGWCGRPAVCPPGACSVDSGAPVNFGSGTIRRLISAFLGEPTPVAAPSSDQLPPPTALPPERSYRYDGDPQDAVPLPQPAPAPAARPLPTPPDGKLVSLPVASPKLRYPAYGEQPWKDGVPFAQIDRIVLRSKGPSAK